MKNIARFILVAAYVATGCTTGPKTYETSQNSNSADRNPAALNKDMRGPDSEYDPGAPEGPEGSSWVELYGSAPNYRAIGSAALGGGEKFRWEMGPMWYRGRLGKDQVKVFVVGQEGAQDENVSNRAFTGSTGTKTQKFLNHIGIYRSYLFMNTFVYTINGQLEDDPKFNYIEQGIGVSNPEKSPIVKYRHKLFDNMLVQNRESVSLFMGVGAGGKASLATWINARGGKCSVAKDMSICDTTNMVVPDAAGNLVKPGKKILVVGVPHPGGASAANGGTDALGNIIRGFTFAAKRVAQMKAKDKTWLPQDMDDPLCGESENYCQARIDKMNQEFTYEDAVIPHRDFAFGTNFMMGYKGTTSNRWKPDSIQVFSNAGTYGDKSARYPNPDNTISKFLASNVVEAGFAKGTDMPWEPPRYTGPSSFATKYDRGPCDASYSNYQYRNKNKGDVSCKFADLLTSWPNKPQNAQSLSFGPTSTYRGRTSGVQTLVIADQTSHDDFFSGRALTGKAGQQLQTILNEQGKPYLILRTSPFDALKDFGGVNADVLNANKAHLKTIIDYVKSQNPSISKILVLGSWAEGFATEAGLTFEKVTLPAKVSAIPRADLPFHSRWWMGTSGDRAGRGSGGEIASTKKDGEFHYYRVYAPMWNSDRTLIPPIHPDDLKLLNDSEVKKITGSQQ